MDLDLRDMLLKAGNVEGYVVPDKAIVTMNYVTDDTGAPYVVIVGTHDQMSKVVSRFVTLSEAYAFVASCMTGKRT